MTTTESDQYNALNKRFRGYYPVVIDIETSGFDAQTNALLEIAVMTLMMDESGWLKCDRVLHFNLSPFVGAILDADALAFNGIDPNDPLREAVSEQQALKQIFQLVSKGMRAQQCHRAVVVAHNASFDHGFLFAAAKRVGLKRNPFHPFVTFDTTSLSGLVLGQTVLARACEAAGIPFNHECAHSALYDTVQTATLFCELVNSWKRLGGWPPATGDIVTEGSVNS